MRLATGHSFLARCAFSALAAAEAATGKLIPESAEQRGCVDSAEGLSEEALGTSPRCEQCPEGCVVVLLLQALALPDFAEVRLCSYSLMYYFRANAYFKESLSPTGRGTCARTSRLCSTRDEGSAPKHEAGNCRQIACRC
ncbi:unnamed protein product [Effrenium voratum]|nr:unnamed protein product [Effrenium voratum]